MLSSAAAHHVRPVVVNAKNASSWAPCSSSSSSSSSFVVVAPSKTTRRRRTPPQRSSSTSSNNNSNPHLGSSSSSSRRPNRRSASSSPVTTVGAIGGFGAGVATEKAAGANPLDDHIAVDRFYKGLRQLHASPDVFLVDGFLTSDECDSIVAAAETRAMDQSPVVYAGWTNDVGDIVTNAARGPALWGAALSMLAGASANGPGPGVLVQGVGTYAALVAVAGAAAGAWVKYRELQLQGMRTSTSCVLDGASPGERAYVRNTEALLPGSAFTTFEAPTVIRYQAGQRLAAHFDANRGAEVEDANRGGQTLATLLLYLNDVGPAAGGKTVFGRLGLEVQPKKGQCLLFFPATKGGVFDERVEHEGTEAFAEKWICRIWRHIDQVPPPFGLPTGYKP